MIVELPAAARYSLDTNCFITSWQRTYPPDMFQPVWAHLERLADDGIVVVSNVVLLELERKADEVCAWCQDHEICFWISSRLYRLM